MWYVGIEVVAVQDILKAKARGDWEAVNEASLGRVWQHMQKSGKQSFAILTSWRAGKTKRENIADFKKLQGEVRSLGSGFFKLAGHWKECQDPDIPYEQCPKDQLVDAAEPSLFVTGLKLKDVKRLGARYEQDAIVFGGPETDGKVVLVKRGGGVSDIGSFSPSKVSQAYSRVRGRPFVFEYVAQTWAEKMVEQSLGRDLPSLVDELSDAVDDL
jgi:hypothetical protein